MAKKSSAIFFRGPIDQTGSAGHAGGAKPGFEIVDDRPALFLPKIASLIGTAATDLAFNGIELGDAFERFAGDRRGPGRGELEEAPHP